MPPHWNGCDAFAAPTATIISRWYVATCSEIGRYARIDTWQFRLLKAATPGPFTFLLPATRETPRRLQHPKRRTIGIRVPDTSVPRMLLTEARRAADELDPAAAGRRVTADRR